MRKVLLFILFITASYAAFNKYQRFFFDKPEPTFSDTLNKKTAENFAGFHITNLSGSVLPNAGTAEEKLAIIDSYYRLKPDRRFISAITSINQFFLQKTDNDKVSYQFVNHVWEIRHGDDLLGTLPEYPDFPDYMALLQQLAAQLASRQAVVLAPDGLIPSQEKPFFYHELTAPLNECGAQWLDHKYNKNCLNFAVRAYSAIMMQAFDNMGAFDEIYGQSVAFLAIAKSLTGEAYAEEEAIMAHQMGYTTQAKKLLDTLPDDTPYKLYVNQQTQRLQDLADNDKSNGQALFLALMRLGYQENKTGFYDLLKKQKITNPALILPIIKAELQIDDFEISRTRGWVLQGATLFLADYQPDWLTLASKTVEQILTALAYTDEAEADTLINQGANALLSLMKTTEKDVVDKFEAAMDKKSGTPDTPFLPKHFQRAYLSGYFYSGLYLEAKHRLFTKSSIPEAEALLQKFATSTGAFQREFVSWYQNLINAEKGMLSENDLFRNLESLQHMGMWPIIKAFDSNQNLFKFGAPDMRNAVKLMFNKFDTRPQLLAQAANISATQLYDLDLSEKLHAASVKLNGDDGTGKKNLALLHKDPDALVSAINDEFGYKNLAEQLQFINVPDKKLREIYDAAREKYPNNRTIVSDYTKYLRDSAHEPQQALKIAQNWLTNNPQTDPNVDIFDMLFTTTSAAKSLNALNRHKEALAILSPIVESWQGGVMTEYANTLALLGRDQEAEDYFSKTLARYPGATYAMLDYCSFLWNRGRYDAAADLVKPRIENVGFLRELADLFGKTFAGKTEAAKQAFLAIAATNQTAFTLDSFLHYASKNKMAAIVAPLYPMIKNQGGGVIFIAIHQYEANKESNGKDLALEQLKAGINPAVLNRLSMPIYEEGQYDLLWDLIEQPTANDYPEMVWLLRATTYRLEGGTAAQKQALDEFYQQPINNNRIIAIGKYLLDGLSREELLVFAKNNNNVLSEVAFYIAVRHMSEQQFVEANRWLRLSIETAEIRNHELAWANQYLYNWYSDYLSLAQRNSYKLMYAKK
ncbi:hypothetical protein [Methylobacter sp.]|uniref:hypothetical protein n=1 Tax=Methylobacter sp. TaxID=2051955 RepID=UPI00120BDB6B|nr:hypothetical protein [Methylobacter sp.]TAK62050.1 MAG: hypothetical protein EPO18_11865 [Methylobacter sp.]